MQTPPPPTFGVSAIDLANTMPSSSLYHLLHLRLGCLGTCTMELFLNRRSVLGLPTNVKIPINFSCPTCTRENSLLFLLNLLKTLLSKLWESGFTWLLVSIQIAPAIVGSLVFGIHGSCFSPSMDILSRVQTYSHLFDFMDCSTSTATYWSRCQMNPF